MRHAASAFLLSLFLWEGAGVTQRMWRAGWLDSLQHRVPGASILFVGTHVDEAHEEDKDWQCALIQRTVRQRLQHHQVRPRCRRNAPHACMVHALHHATSTGQHPSTMQHPAASVEL